MGTRQGIVAVVMLAVIPTARGDEELLARFEREFPGAASRLERRFSQARGTCVLRTVAPGESKPNRTSDAEFVLDHGFEKVTIRRMPPGAPASAAAGEFVYCVGPNTVFYLTRPPGAKEFSVEGLGSTPSDRSAYVTLFGRFVKAHYGVFGQSLSRLMAKSSFRAVKAERLTKDKHFLVKVDFEAGDREPRSLISIVFEPDAGWIIHSSEYRIEGKPGLRIMTEVEYGSPRDGFPIPRRVTCRDARGETSTCEFVDWSFGPTPEAEFKMPYYGLPDLIANASSRSSTLPYWLGGIAAAGLTVAMLLRRNWVKTANLSTS